MKSYKLNLWNYGIFRDILKKKNTQKAYLPKTSVSRQMISEIFAQLWSDDFVQILLNFLLFIMLRNKSNLEWYVYGHVVIISSFIEQCELHCS